MRVVAMPVDSFKAPSSAARGNYLRGLAMHADLNRSEDQVRGAYLSIKLCRH
jgi:hypothetical protein